MGGAASGRHVAIGLRAADALTGRALPAILTGCGPFTDLAPMLLARTAGLPRNGSFTALMPDNSDIDPFVDLLLH